MLQLEPVLQFRVQVSRLPTQLTPQVQPVLQVVSHAAVPHDRVQQPPTPQLEQLPHEAQGIADSHPSPGIRLQSWKPALHDAMPQVPDMQAPVAFAGAQARPHAPQSVALSSGRSQPSA